jgi:hypothetical protein
MRSSIYMSRQKRSIGRALHGTLCEESTPTTHFSGPRCCNMLWPCRCVIRSQLGHQKGPRTPMPAHHNCAFSGATSLFGWDLRLTREKFAVSLACLPQLHTFRGHVAVFFGSILKKTAINGMESESSIRGRKCYSRCPLFDAKKRSEKLGRQG